jgi:hypothetical protein
MDNIKVWQSLPTIEKQRIFTEIAIQKRIPVAAAEKDWGVVQTLRAIFETEIKSFTVFKGGTSLSKAWNLIERFSEDIDLALDRSFLGFDGEMTISQVKKLRKKSYEYISKELFAVLQIQFEAMGLAVKLATEPVKNKDQDPIIIQVIYPSIVDVSSYILPRVLIELGSRSLKEPFTIKPIRSYVGEIYADKSFADEPINIPSVNPERTFLEKIFLLHEEFQKPADKIRVNRMSRHLYDLGVLNKSMFAQVAFSDNLELFKTIVAHRKLMTPLRGIDYELHKPPFINPLPPDFLVEAWQKDYQFMQESMIFGDSPPFDKLIAVLRILKQYINSLMLR